MSAPRFRFGRFEIDLRWWLLALVMAAIACGLGFWQLSRAAQKTALEDAYYDRLAMTAVSCAAAVAQTKPAYVRVDLDGVFVPGREYLLDNRTANSVAGYEVLTRFRCRDGTRLLVNRGWIAAGDSRDVIPIWTTPSQPVRLSGFVHVPAGLPPLIGANDWPRSWPASGPKRIGYLDVQRMTAEGLRGQYRYPVTVDAAGPGVLLPNYSVESVSPTRHWGYAVQWFAMALGIVLYLGYRSLSRS